MSGRFDLEEAHRLRESETEWLRQSAARIRAAHARARRAPEVLDHREDAR